ncbi:uncharacterized protein F5891DRAFT_987460 [Suillus fuscotomentosus]|uniref:Uncharacterized protein n=1 Tax=Suillus fuscotomentosus TaxID=1912939 RepID=A0AAD4HD72_9AGAM|nr:uncharacterized protein F5891DRAFT_987460 [Suillus fuscotomentosus]KAG1889078.1 hypothetical protein F5891DRAFT_987460 [Suillus fuscotomentosus]
MTRMSRSQARINSLSSSTFARQRTRTQTAAFLLGIRPNLPDANDEDFSRVNTVRHLSQGITNRFDSVEKVTAQQYQAPELEKDYTPNQILGETSLTPSKLRWMFQSYMNTWAGVYPPHAARTHHIGF